MLRARAWAGTNPAIEYNVLDFETAVTVPTTFPSSSGCSSDLCAGVKDSPLTLSQLVPADCR